MIVASFFSFFLQSNLFCRYQENLLSQCDGQLDSIQQLIYSLEFAQVELQVVENLKLGNESLKKLNSLMSVEEVERIMEETREAVEYQVSSETRILLKMVPFQGPRLTLCVASGTKGIQGHH